MAAKPGMRRIEILLVEDSPADVLIAREALREAKLMNTIHVVEDGMKAMEYLRRRGEFATSPRPDLILLDLNLPRKNGREVLAEIKADSALKSIPVVVLTTSNAEEDILKSYNLHANCYVVKPVEFNSFVQVVQSIQQFWFTVVTLPPAEG
jgi:two-component system, chemotaxis family, response regulator Rcp1